MSINPNTLHSLVSISQFSKGQAIKVFNRLQEESQLIVLKNNAPVAVLLSPEEFTRLIEIEENYHLPTLAQERLSNNNIDNAIPEPEMIASLGITENEINAANDISLD